MSKSVQDSLESIRGSVNSINWKSVWANPLLLAWISAAVLSVAVPSIQWSVQRSSFYQSYGYAVEYENQQREYEEQQNDDGNNDDVYGSVYESCSSWNWWCIKKQAYYADYYGDGNKDDGDDGGAGSMTFPSWFIFLGGQTENMRRWEEENTGVRQEEGSTSYSGTQAFVCVWTILLFLVIVAYGAKILYGRGCRRPLVVLSLFFAQFCFINLLMLPSGTISSEDRQMEDSVYGWYGQVGVLMAYINVWFLAFSILFPVAFFIVDYVESRKSDADAGDTAAADGEYQNFSEENKTSIKATSNNKDLGTLA